MKRCNACGFENPDEGKFCKSCGTKLEEKITPKFCRHCGREVAAGTMYCVGCGKPLQSSVNTQTNVTPEVSEDITPNKMLFEKDTEENKKSKKPLVIIICILLAVLIVLGVVFVMKDNIGKKGNKSTETTVEKEEAEQEEDKEIKESTEEEADLADAENESVEINKNVDYSAPIPLQALVAASSTAMDGNYSAEALVDSNANTVWGEGSDGLGQGEYLVYNLQEEKDVFGIAILPGNLNTSGDFYRYGCPTRLEVTVGEKTQSVELTTFSPNVDFSGNTYLYIDLEEPVRAKEIKISIADAREGTEIQTTCITEMHLYTYPASGDRSGFSVENWKVAYSEPSDYILPGSDSRYLTMSDLEGLTAEECRLARNELYARHGRIFEDEGLKNYFGSKDWYNGTISGEDFSESMLNDYEIANRDLIVEYETEQGYR